MLKRVSFPLTAISMLVFISSIFAADVTAQETRDLNPFTGIGIGISADVFYTPGNTHEIRIEGNQKDIEDLIAKVENGYLKLNYKDLRVKRSKLAIYISSKELDKVGFSGSGKFISEKAIATEEMSIALSGSGTILFTSLKAEEVDIKISGSGDIVIEKGSTEEADLKISGSGKFLAEEFEVSEFSVAISGSGGCKITVKEELDVRISGSGNVYYHGNPQLNSTSSGSGKVRSL